MTTQPKQPNSALLTRLHKLIEALERDGERMQAEQEQAGYAPTLDLAIDAYADLTKRLKLRLAGNPRTLRRRLAALKRELARRKHIQEVFQGLEGLEERHRLEAALRAEVLETLVGKLEVMLHPGLARQRVRLAAPPHQAAAILADLAHDQKGSSNG